MGYYKQEQVADVTEVADRLPPPKPALEHAVFFPNRKLRRLSERRRGLPASVTIGVGLGVMFGLGVVVGVMS
jgi:hypothetical protein